MAKHVQKADNVFLNCPFDEEYKEIFDALVFTIFDCGFVPRCSLEVDDAAEVRIDKINRIIEECKFGIHDLSRTELNSEGLPRFNMPLELGLFLGAKRFGAKLQKDKICIVLDKVSYRYQKFISDIGGQDIKSHGGKVSKCISVVRDGLNAASGRKTIPGGTEIHRRYRLFKEQLPSICATLKMKEMEVTYVDYTNFIPEWIETYEG